MLAHEITFIVLWKLFVKGIALTFSTWSLHVFLELLKRLFFASAAGRRVGQGAKCLQRGKITLSLRKLANQAMRISQNLLRVYNMLMKTPSSSPSSVIITIISSSWHLLYNFHRKISRMIRNNFMMHLCTVATLCFLK